jgi:large subunit ribosomal protein L30
MGSAMAKIKITQVRSAIKRPKDQRRTIEALGLGKINRSVEVEKTPQILGMVNKVRHLVSVSE